MQAQNESDDVEAKPAGPWGKLVRTALWGGLALILAGIVGGGLLSSLLGRGGREIPEYSTVPDFSLTERSGGKVTRATLLRKVWVADFFYARCEDTCPLQSAEMARLQADFAREKDFRLVSITIDPPRDTQASLREYADRFGADGERWLFITGDQRAIHDLVRNGFRLSVAVSEPPRGPAIPGPRPGDERGGGGGADRPHAGPDSGAATRLPGRIFRIFEARAAWAHHPAGISSKHTHSSRFVLVDRSAVIRGYYHSDDTESLARLRRDVRTLLKR